MSSPPNPAADAADPYARTRALRDVFGQFATGVCLFSAKSVGEQTEPFAITVNSFTSLSLEPPLILWCLQKGATTTKFWLESPKFSVNILSADQQTLCRQYAIRGNQTLEREHYEFAESGNPHIVGATAHLDCRLQATHEAGDHYIMVAAIEHYELHRDKQPMVYLHGDFLEQT